MQEKDRDGNNVLHYAFQNFNYEIIGLLLRSSYGRLEDRNKFGRSPIETVEKLTPVLEKIVTDFNPNLQFDGQFDYLFESQDINRYKVLKDQLDFLKLETRVFKRVTSVTEKSQKVIVLVKVPAEKL